MGFSFPPKRILAAYDLSGPGEAALRAAVLVARASGASLEAVYADAPQVAVPYEYDALDAAAAHAIQLEQARFKDDWRAKARAATARLPRGRVTLNWALGFPAETVLDLAARTRADLIVCGTHGRTGAKRLFLGSVAEALVRRSPVPVLCVHEGASLKGPILAPYNLLTYSDEALACALDLGEATGRPVTALYVAAPRETQAQAQLELAVRLEAQLGDKAGAGLTYKVRRGQPRDEIAREAARGYGLIVLSSHVKEGLAERALGSVAERLLRQVRAAVLAVPSAPRPGRPPLRRAAAATRRSTSRRRVTWNTPTTTRRPR